MSADGVSMSSTIDLSKLVPISITDTDLAKSLNGVGTRLGDGYDYSLAPHTFKVCVRMPNEKPQPRPKTFIALDLETTGLYPSEHGICQIGAWATGENEDHFKGYFLKDCNPEYATRDSTFKSLLCRKVKFDAGAFKVNGFTGERIGAADPLFDVLGEFNTWVNKWTTNTDVVFVCQNTPFDIGFMRAAYQVGGFNDKVFRRNLDTISFGFMVYGEVLSLAKLCEREGIKNGDAHDALADAYTTSKLFHRLHAKVKSNASVA